MCAPPGKIGTSVADAVEKTAHTDVVVGEHLQLRDSTVDGHLPNEHSHCWKEKDSHLTMKQKVTEMEEDNKRRSFHYAHIHWD